MMQLSGKGVCLKRLEEIDLEMVRNWRNAPHVQSQMEFQAEISPEMQAKWFAGLDPQHDWYFLFGENENEWCGLVHIKDIDAEAKCGEAGVFTGEKEALGTPLPVLAVLRMMNFAFEELGLERLQAKMRANVPAILQFNHRLGYKLLAGQAPNAEFIRMEVSRADFAAAGKKLRF